MVRTRSLWRILPVRDPRSPRGRRFALAAVVVIGATLFALRLGVGVYVNSSRGKAAVGKELQAMFGLPVEVADVDLGTHTSAVKFRVLAPPTATGPSRVEVLSVESAAADVSFAEVFSHRIAPKHVELNGVFLSLQVGPEGVIRTPIPPIADGPAGSVPRVAVERGRVSVCQDGLPPFLVTGIGVRVEPDRDAVKLTGAIDDPSWGKWTIAGQVERATRAGWVEFTTATELGWERLREIPFVPAGAWYGVPTGGGIAIRVTIGEDRVVRFTVTGSR
ncbi:MAG TPA: hypothetical protein VMZ71_10395 [Gemmataceae bacterium]|nr:hypothetical protein [Gemmataceae bacterium]